MNMKNKKFNRRNFIRNTSLGFLGAGLLGKKGFATLSPVQENELDKIKGYRRLGRTGAMAVSYTHLTLPTTPYV